MNVTVIGRHSCQPCRATRRRLDILGVTYTFVDIDSLSSSALAALSRAVGERPALPIVIAPDAGTNPCTGHRPELLDRLAADPLI